MVEGVRGDGRSYHGVPEAQIRPCRPSLNRVSSGAPAVFWLFADLREIAGEAAGRPPAVMVLRRNGYPIRVCLFAAGWRRN